MLALIRGLSFGKGIFFIGENHISCAYNQDGKMNDWVKPISLSTLILTIKHIVNGMPLLFKVSTFFYLSLIFVPKILHYSGYMMGWHGLPYYFLFYYVYGTHFFFPYQLRKYHGAEHKIFSYPGIKSLKNINKLKGAEITNRHCSTNIVVLYFTSVIVLGLFLKFFIHLNSALALATYISIVVALVINNLLDRRGLVYVKRYVLAISYFLQKKVTTAEPDDLHIKTAIRSYRRLALKEFPHLLKSKQVEREGENVAIIDITIIPIGTNQPSVSGYVAEIHKVLETYKEKVNYTLTPMSTIIEGEINDLLDIVKVLHEVPFQKGVSRVATNIRIDDRRDKNNSMEGKLQSVNEKLNNIQ